MGFVDRGLGALTFPYYHTLPTPIFLSHIVLFHTEPDTYDHRVWKTGLPVRSAVLKPHILHSQ
ncbi:hypothetical protein PDIP_40760 [Penicillium digitatum Pd1]|uniref:Uncharacterized protein n=1 Tax=Penicillium digitatum (strain Pd1 / CECT 20795) TaxID=1170230 RepID=K9G1X0_PEND1|nr:hypothetical protein PDIP_40760 [Penicillium digitatum Pd1]EKV15324.1 hypothetical protein PDIP_40760 [Penicillium digitatum Pd1]